MSPRIGHRARVVRLVGLSAAFCILALLIGRTAINWRLHRLDEALEPSAARLQQIRDQANAAEFEAKRLPDYPLPEELITALLRPADFRVYRSVAEVPGSVRSAFAKAAREESFSMADRDGRWEPTDVILDPKLPRRRLTTAAMSADLCLLFYEHGGIGKNDNVAAFRISGNHAKPIWHAYVSRQVGDAAALAEAVKDKDYREAPFF